MFILSKKIAIYTFATLFSAFFSFHVQAFDILGAVSGVAKKAGGVAKTVGDTAKATTETVVKSTEKATQDVSERVKGAAEDTAETVIKSSDKAVEAIGKGDVATAGEAAQKAVQDVSETIGEAAKDTTGTVSKAVGETVQDVTADVDEVTQEVSQAVEETVQDVVQDSEDQKTEGSVTAETSSTDKLGEKEPILSSHEYVRPSSLYESMVSHYGRGSFGVDPLFTKWRKDLPLMNDYAYALGKSLIYQQAGEASKQASQEEKRDALRAQFEADGWELRHIKGTSGVETSQEDIMGLVAYHAEKKLIYVIYRRSSSIADWEVSLDLAKATASEKGLSLPGQYHRGFLNKYVSGRQDLIDALSYFKDKVSTDDRKKIRLIVTGQNHGGGLATIALADIGFNLSKDLFGQDYVNTVSHQIYGWLVGGARAADAEAVNAIKVNFGEFNIIRQQALPALIEVTESDNLGQDLINKLPLVAANYISYSAYKAIGIFALDKEHRDNVQYLLNSAIAVSLGQEVEEVEKKLGEASPEETLGTIFALKASQDISAGESVLESVKSEEIVEAESALASGFADLKSIVRMLIEGWKYLKQFYADRELEFPYDKPFGTQPTRRSGFRKTPAEVDHEGNVTARIESKYITSDQLKTVFLSRNYPAVSFTPAGNTPKEDEQLHDRLLEELEGLSYDQINKPEISGLQRGLAPLAENLMDENSRMRYAWMITSAIEHNTVSGAKKCADKFEQDPNLKPMLDRPRDTYQMGMVIFVSQVIDPRNDNVVDERQKQYCGVLFGTKR